MNTQIDTQMNCPLDQEDCPVLTALQDCRKECAQLRELSRTDALTGFFNLRHLTEALEGEMERTRRTGLPTSLIMIDLDHFKKINDVYGHEAGNMALERSSEVFRNQIRRIDVPCRYGGEEFAIILPNTPLNGAILVAERLRKTLADTALSFQENTFQLTASFGVDVYYGRTAIEIKELIHQTDQFLLQAKQQGRNQTCYDQEKIAPPDSEVTREEREALGFLRRNTDAPDEAARTDIKAAMAGKKR